MKDSTNRHGSQPVSPRATRPGLRPSATGGTRSARSPDKVYTVARLLQDVQQQLESNFGTVWLQAEISNLSRPASGHLYFSLKDSRAQVRCAMFKGRNQRLDFRPADGDAVLVRGTLGLYAARGDFQLIVEHMEPAGAGRLQAAFERTKRELDELGWFASEHKAPPPPTPQAIGVVTSPTGAALRDVLHVLARRYPQAPVVLYPTQTQGAQAAPAVCRAIQQASRRREVDVLLVVRGGGSLEDLWAFNERSVAGAVRDCPIPVISGVGHEVDVTITDLVADLRAPTPSVAAEMATPDQSGMLEQHARLHHRLQHAMLRALRVADRHHQALAARLAARRPERLLAARARHTDELGLRLQRVTQQRLDARRQAVASLDARLLAWQPRRSLSDAVRRHAAVQQRLIAAMQRRLATARSRSQIAERALQAVGPTAVLSRGYALLSTQDALVTRVADAAPGAILLATLSDGKLTTRVEKIHSDTEITDAQGPDKV